jgi:acyl-CoA thioester hydrolase
LMVTVTSFHVKRSEIDKMNIVYHAYYARWFELGRKDYLNKAGLPNLIITRQGFYLPLSQIECKYKNPAKYGDEISVFTSIIYMSCVKLKFEYKVINSKTGKVLAVGNTVHAWTDRQIRPLNIEKSAPEIYTLLKYIKKQPAL